MTDSDIGQQVSQEYDVLYNVSSGEVHFVKKGSEAFKISSVELKEYRR